MLIHHTSDINSAKSIISSSELWMKCVGKTKDTNEIYHFMKEFNRHHYLHEVDGILDNLINYEKINDYTILDIIYGIIENKVAWQNGISYGAVFSELLRNNSFLVCFTENSQSNFHSQEYGDISFEFSKDPLMKENIASHVFIEEKIIYFNSKEIYNLQNIESEPGLNKESDMLSNEEKSKEEIVTFLEETQEHLSTLGFLKELKEDTRVKMNRIDRIMLQNIVKWRKKMSFLKKENPVLDSAVRFLTKEMVKERARKKTEFNKEDENFYKELIRTSKKYDLMNQTKLNLIGCFLKDKEFVSDAETRILALPKNNSGVKMGSDWLKVPFDKKKLKKVRISPEKKDKKDLKIELEQVLKENGYREVSVE
ncbi:hypothetical protein KXS12_16160 [Priestia filamentosa]|uniref:hypothetical protein n=1 Tax=Priestia filamentosa TaxID=1402861 RepID=UPI003F15B443